MPVLPKVVFWCEIEFGDDSLIKIGLLTKSWTRGMLVLWNDGTKGKVESFHEEVPVHAGADRLCFTAGGEWHPGGGV